MYALCSVESTLLESCNIIMSFAGDVNHLDESMVLIKFE
jgi:hypothetical protein